MCVCVSDRERESVCVSDRESVCVSDRESVCVSDRESVVCVCVCCVCVCVCVSVSVCGLWFWFLFMAVLDRAALSVGSGVFLTHCVWFWVQTGLQSASAGFCLNVFSINY